jgi:hypothetical protein
MKKWAIPLAAAGVLAVVAIAGAAFALNDTGDDDAGAGVSRDVDERGESGGDGSGGDVAGICLEGAIDCDDTIDTPANPDVCIQIFPTPPECANPDEPVSNEPPIIDDPAPNHCVVAGNGSADWYSAECEKAAVALAIEDLSLRLGSPQAITVQSVEFVQWPDSCLGISKTDIACAEVITPGFKVVLAVGGQTFAYHTDTGTRAELAE